MTEYVVGDWYNDGQTNYLYTGDGFMTEADVQAAIEVEQAAEQAARAEVAAIAMAKSAEAEHTAAVAAPLEDSLAMAGADPGWFQPEKYERAPEPSGALRAAIDRVWPD